MNKRINFEDTLFIINVRVRMIRDLIQLDIDKTIFYSQTMADLEFINLVMNNLTGKFLENLKILDREAEADNLLDAEWQFGQLLNEISNNSSPFATSSFPEMPAIIGKMRKDSNKRKTQIEELYEATDISILEPVVSNAELNGLLGQ
ncbi:MAG: hypothetical protein FWC21_00475 [Treponema sp.]|nr:hypothetical protein [Treponema sp.]